MEAPCRDSVVKGWGSSILALTSIMTEVAHRTEEAAMVAVTFVWLSYIYFDLFWCRE